MHHELHVPVCQVVLVTKNKTFGGLRCSALTPHNSLFLPCIHSQTAQCCCTHAGMFYISSRLRGYDESTVSLEMLHDLAIYYINSLHHIFSPFRGVPDYILTNSNITTWKCPLVSVYTVDVLPLNPCREQISTSFIHHKLQVLFVLCFSCSTVVSLSPSLQSCQSEKGSQALFSGLQTLLN